MHKADIRKEALEYPKEGEDLSPPHTHTQQRRQCNEMYSTGPGTKEGLNQGAINIISTVIVIVFTIYGH